MNARTAVLWGACLLGCGAWAAKPPGVRLLGSVDGVPPRPGWVYAKKGQRVTLHARVTPGAPAVADVRWRALEPVSTALDNTTPSFHFEEVSYRAHVLPGCRGKLSCAVEVTPRHLPTTAGLEGLGTLAFQVEVTFEGGKVARSPGLESVDRGGLSREVMKVAVRLDDTYRGYLTELLNTPYIFGSDGPVGRHQADLLIGSDCADLAVYGARRAGLRVRYASTWTLEEQAPVVRVAKGQDASGAFVDARGRRIPVGEGEGRVRPGDLLLFPGSRHVGVLWEDRPPRGVLDGGDTMFHTCWAPPTVEPISASRCASNPVRILRWAVP